jgi:MYXO-CTERM domain-containing protein
MNFLKLLPIGLALAAGVSSFPARATTFLGNGNSAWSGAIGLGSLTLTDNGTTLFGSLTTGGNLNGNAFVLYLQTAGGGFSTTAGFNDSADQLRSALSQYTATGNGGGVGQSILNFSSGFAPNYAIALQPGSSISYGGLWQLANGGANSQNFITSVNLSPTGSDTQGTYSFSLDLTSIGLTPNAGQSIELFGLQVSPTGYSSPEALGGTLTGTSGWNNTQTETSFSTYVATPEPSTMALGAAGLGSLFLLRRRR